MPATLEQRLREKGWSDQEIAKALNIIYSPEKKEKHLIFTQFSSPLIYWSLLVVAIIGNFIASVVLIPIMFFFSETQLYAVIFILAISFGAFFNLLLKDIEHDGRLPQCQASAKPPVQLELMVDFQVQADVNKLIPNYEDH